MSIEEYLEMVVIITSLVELLGRETMCTEQWGDDVQRATQEALQFVTKHKPEVK